MRGQAAVEYLMTYGWAIALLIIILGLIMGTGLLSPTYLVNEECEVGPNFPCDTNDFRVYVEDGNTYIDIRVYNGYGYPIYVSNASAELIDQGTSFNIERFQNNIVESGDPVEIRGIIPDYTMSKDSMAKIKLKMRYFLCAEEVNPDCDPLNASYHNVSGRIKGRVAYAE